MSNSKAIDGVLEKLRAFGLQYPGAHTKSPWPGHLDLAVNDKTFAYLSIEGEPFSISCKLPHSVETALLLPFAAPTAWGLGSSGWVTAQLAEGQLPLLEVFEGWIDESYRAVAPKRLVAKLLPAKAASAEKTAQPSRARKGIAAKSASARKSVKAATKTAATRKAGNAATKTAATRKPVEAATKTAATRKAGKAPSKARKATDARRTVKTKRAR